QEWELKNSEALLAHSRQLPRQASSTCRIKVNMASTNSFGAAAALRVGDATYQIFRLAKLEETGKGNVSRLPFSIKILLENLLRHEDGRKVSAEDVKQVASGGGADAKEM